MQKRIFKDKTISPINKFKALSQLVNHNFQKFQASKGNWFQKDIVEMDKNKLIIFLNSKNIMNLDLKFCQLIKSCIII